MSARDEILGKLRQALARPDLRFPPATTPPLTSETRMTVTRAEGGGYALAERFGQELETLHGSYEILETATEARLALINRLLTWIEEEKSARKGPALDTGQERSVLSWDADTLPVSGMKESLADLGLTLVTPRQLHSTESREAVRFIRFGLSGVEAAFASTGSMLVASGAATSRAASLLPFRHIALIPFDQLYPTLESWLIEKRDGGGLVNFLRSHANLSLITGPSKSADIEMNLTLGVHGPKFVHAILFNAIR